MTAALASQGVQTGTITIASGSTSNTAAINAMGSGGFLLHGGEIASQSGASFAQSSCAISVSGSTVTAARQTGGTNTVTVAYVAVDGDTTNLIASVNFGTVSFNGGQSSGTFSIGAVTTGNTAVAQNGALGTATSVSLNLSWPVWDVASTTTIRMATNTSGGTVTGYACAIEFQSAALQSLQFVSDSAAPSTTTRNHTISAVTLANTFQIYAGMWSSSTNINSARQYGQLNSTTNLLIGTRSAGFITIKYNTFIVELVSGLVETGCQRGLKTLSSASSGTVTISAVTTADAIPLWCGNATTGTNWNAIITNMVVTNTTTLTFATGTSATTDTSYEIIALNPGAGASPDAEADPTGVAGTGAAGTATATGDAEADPTGVAGTGSPGSPTVDLQLNVNVTGVAGTGSPGTVTVTGDANVTPTGVEATGSPGSPTVTLQLDVPVTGVAATGAVGDPTITADANTAPTGVAATGAAGTPTVSADANVALTGVEGAGTAGDVTVDTSSPVNVDVDVTGVVASGAAGDTTVTAGANTTPTGVAATGSAGTITANADANITPTGVAATGAAGTPTVSADANVTLDGVEAAGAAGDPAVTADANVTLDGVEAAGAAGDVDVSTLDTVDVDVTLDGVEAAGAAGDMVVEAVQNQRAQEVSGGLIYRTIPPRKRVRKTEYVIDWKEIERKRRADLQAVVDQVVRPVTPVADLDEEFDAKGGAAKVFEDVGYIPPRYPSELLLALYQHN